MYWFGPFVDLTGKSVNIRTVWKHRLKQSAQQLWTVRKGKHWIAAIFFTLWVATDVLALIEGTTPLIPLSFWGAGFGVALVVFEWWILIEEFKEGAPLHVLWQPRVLPSSQHSYLCVHFESKNDLPFEVRCTFTNEKGIAIGTYPSEYLEFIPSKNNKHFTYQTQITRTALNGFIGFRLYVDIAPLLTHPMLHDHWVYSFALDSESGKFKRTSGQIGFDSLRTQTWWFAEEQDKEWLRWEDGL